MAGRWSTSALRWLGVDTAYSLLRWPQFMSSSYLSPRWPELNLNFSIVDDVVWGLITAFESVALVSMLCFFFLFCGCTI
ncbi:uncharacterized protein LOC8269838 [Ricinus communis]|uniref:Uncharacterized protein n=1 Tax=Ricinus communis TaxID=3988 RepID=B9RFK8_RICCO|nr:uncharacterized protein LOC8269838 [Ricinus communis]EEF49979.1 conserved hypothetical protein [Ricinus communis]|eukprot:XP_015570441.1 uncharacterized protein LOC8269838 [Ricinus communis]